MTYLPPVNGGRINVTLGGNSTSAGAGYIMASTGTVTLAGGNNVTLSQNGNAITISAGAGGAGPAAVYDGANSISTGTIRFSNLNGVSFGINGQTITASHNGLTSQSNQALSGSNGSYTFQTATFGNLNGLSFYTSNGSMVGSYTVPTQSNQTGNIYALGNTTGESTSSSYDHRTLSVDGGGMVSVGWSNSSLRISATQSNQTQGFTAGTTNGANTTLTSTGTFDARSVYLNAHGAVSAGFSASSVIVSAPATSSMVGTGIVNISSNGSTISFGAPAFSAGISNIGNTANTSGVQTGQVVFAGGNNITLSQTHDNGSATITISAGAGGAGFSAGVSTGGNTLNHSGVVSNQVVFAGGNNIVLSGSTNGGSATYTISASAQSNQTVGLYALGNTTQNSSSTRDARSLSFNGIGGITVGYSNGSIQLSGPQTVAQTNQSVGLYALGNTTQNSSTTLDARTLSFNGLGGATVGYSNGSIQISAPAAQTNQSVGLYALGNTTQNSSTTRDARSLSFNGLGGITVGYSNGSIQLSGPQTVAQTNQSIGLYALGNTTQNSSTTLDARTLSFNGLGGATVGYSNGSIQISAPAAQTNQTLGIYAVGNTTGQSSSSTHDARTLSIDGAGMVSAGWSNGTFRLSATQSNQTANFYVSSNSTQLSSTAGIDLRSVTFQGAGIASVGVSQGKVLVSVPAGGGGITNINLSAGTTSNNLSNVTFADSNGIGFGLNASTITASHNIGYTWLSTDNTIGQSSSTTLNATAINISGKGAISGGFSGSTLQISVPQTSSLSAVGNVSIATNVSTISISGKNPDLSFYAAGNTTQNSSSVLNATSIVFNGLGAATVGYSAGSVQVSVPAPATFSSSVIGKQHAWATSTASLGQNSLYLFPEIVDDYVTGSIVKIPLAVTNSSSAFAAHTRGYTANFGIYSRHNTNSTVLTRVYSTSYTAGFSANSNGTWAASIITGLGNSTSYNTLTASSAGLNLSQSIHGSRELMIAFATLFSPGEYWFAFNNSSSSAGAAGNLFNVAFPIFSSTSGNAFGVSQGTSSRGIGRNIGHGTYSATTGALPAGISMTMINQLGVNPIMYFMNETA